MADAEMSWWSPNGWRQEAPPAPYVEPEASEAADALSASGYESIGPGLDDGATQIEYKVYRNKDGHLMVQIWDVNECLSEFFVARDDVAPFFTDKFPSLMRGMAAVERIDHDRAIVKAFIAFVRHGHGIKTIDEFGTMNQDERAREIQNRSRPNTATRP